MMKPEPIDHIQWMQQPLIWGERCRGRSLAWTPDAHWFINDPLGPVPHCHPDATELAYLAQGSMEIEVGGSKRVYNAGDLLLMPPDKFHNYWLAGDETVCLFVVVAPNHKAYRWRTEDFPPEAHSGDGPNANIFQSDILPSNQHFACERRILPPGESEPDQQYDLKDRVIYILEGVAELRVNTLTGPLAPQQYQHIPATYQHRIRNPGYTSLSYLSVMITDPATEHGTELVE
ncbi:MAG: cupin domain-containing protein [Anaerolineae bacterium]